MPFFLLVIVVVTFGKNGQVINRDTLFDSMHASTLNAKKWGSELENQSSNDENFSGLEGCDNSEEWQEIMSIMTVYLVSPVNKVYDVAFESFLPSSSENSNFVDNSNSEDEYTKYLKDLFNSRKCENCFKQIEVIIKEK